MSEGDAEKTGIALNALNFTYKIRERSELKITKDVINLINDRTPKSLVGKEISIYLNDNRVGIINADALLWSMTKDAKFTY